MRQKSKLPTIIFFLLFIATVTGVVFVLNSATFEQQKPQIKLPSGEFINLSNPLKVSISDPSLIKEYRVEVNSGGEKIVLSNEILMKHLQNIELSLKLPRSLYRSKSNKLTLSVYAKDASKWNFFDGNSAIVQKHFTIDKKRPTVSIISNSYKIRKGGSALVIFSAKDDNLRSLYIDTNFGKKFKPQPFYKNGYYVSLLAWPVTQKNFKATIVATDKAGNVTKKSIPFYLKDKFYKVSKIKLSNNFLDGKIAELAEEFEETQGIEGKIKKFKIINEDVRKKNEDMIHKITSKVSNKRVSDFHLNKLYPLKNAAVVASFGDHRKYFYNGKQVSSSNHLGLDLASVSHGAIKTQNSANVVYSDYNGLYGNMPILYHGLGLYTLYGHCSSSDVQEGDSVHKGSKIANTGKSGYAMGDHLHFGVLVQGIEVRPEEWMDSDWMKANVKDVMNSAKKIIDRK
ncbi:MAG: M23 family metallopeptidase [Campylobacterota bacterium]|nr:M23 family metallopeptidase [Campylobacterota bacterium]